MATKRQSLENRLTNREFSLEAGEDVEEVLTLLDNAEVYQEQLKAQLAEVTKRANALERRIGAVLVCLGAA